jgi:hypothetical protein
MIPVTKHICRALLVGALLFIPVSVGSAAHVSTPSCAETLINVWYATGKIALTYPESCYQQAIRNLPSSVRVYSAALQDFETALAEVSQSGPRSTSTSIDTSTAPESFPVILIVLGVVAIIVVLAGVAGVLWRRSHPDDGPDA